MSDKKTFRPVSSRRIFLKKMAYVAPTLLSLPAVASFASAGSGYSGGMEGGMEGGMAGGMMGGMMGG